MENLLESNERTLVMFDAVCSGLASCLALVHSDIRQMTEHRNKLALIEQQQIQAKLIPAQELIVVTNNNNTSNSNSDTCNTSNNNNNVDEEVKREQAEEADPHHLAGLKLLDKRLADSFSQALNLSDLQKSSMVAKQQSHGQNKASIFHVLLGKGRSGADRKSEAKKAAAAAAELSREPLDNKAIIDDINRQTRLAMQYSKQLEAHLFKVEDLRSRYEMHLKMGLVVKSVARAYLPSHGSHCSPATLSRRHNCSSLVIEDGSSSIGTHSSLSSLNLSTWSSSRGDKGPRSALAAKHQHHSSTTNGLQNHQQQHTHSPDSSYNLGDLTRRRVSSHFANGAAGPGHYNYGEWPAATTEKANNYGAFISNKQHETSTLSKSSYHLNASQTSLKNKTGSSKRQQLAASKTTIKEFIENIDKIEAEFESYMGSFLLAIEDIQGFARVCQGDVFEISIKYGDAQKFKTKISVLKDNRQKCDIRQAVFKARLADVLAIKAYECKGLGKRVLLGHKLCETRDLFTARSQLMTISLNQTGSIKLNLIVTWNPLHMAPNGTPALPDTDLSHVTLPVCISTSSMSSVYSVDSNTTTINIRSQQQANRPRIASPDIDQRQRQQQQQQLQQYHHHNQPPSQQQQLQHQQQESLYQTLVDPIYGYTYIPPPDYLNNEIREA